MLEPQPAWHRFRKSIETPDLPGLGPAARPGRLPLPELSGIVSGFIRESGAVPAVQPPLRAAALLWHDYLDESHSLSQDIHDADGSFLHGIMHRREPDYPNAKYWFHRVGNHPCFSDLAARVRDLLDNGSISVERPANGNDWVEKLLPSGRWDPFAFVDACQAAGRPGPGESAAPILRAIQEIEFDALIRHILRGT